MKYVFEKGVWKVVLSCSVVMMLATFFIVACSKDDVVERVDSSSQVLEKSDFKKELTEISSIHFEFETNEGAVISATPFASYFFLSKSNPKYDEYLKLAQGDRFKSNFRKITIAPVIDPSLGKILIDKIEALSQDELSSILRSYVRAEKKDSSLGLRSTSLSSSMTKKKAKEFFKSFQRKTCPITPMLHCIPFRWTRDGCFARAHYMRKLMADEGYDCQKIFAYSLDDNVPLSVVNFKGSCIEWRYHVAPLVTIRGVGDRVLDPSLFDEPVSPQTWIDRMKSNCSGAGIPAIKTKITPSDVYYEDYYTGYRSYDDDYSDTYKTMMLYSDDEDF